MDILGIGMPEFVFIVIIALIVLGPKDMQKAGKTIGSFLRKVVMSPEWRTVKDVSRKVSNLPTQWMREANEDLQKFRDEVDLAVPDRAAMLGAWTSGANTQKTSVDEETAADTAEKNVIAPPEPIVTESADDDHA